MFHAGDRILVCTSYGEQLPRIVGIDEVKRIDQDVD